MYIINHQKLLKENELEKCCQREMLPSGYIQYLCGNTCEALLFNRLESLYFLYNSRYISFSKSAIQHWDTTE